MSQELEQEVVDTATEEQAVEEVQPQETPAEPSPVSYEDGMVKVNLAELNKPEENAVQEQSADDSDAVVGEPENTSDSQEVVEEVRDTEEEKVVLQEITEEEVEEQAENLQEQVDEAVQESQDTAEPLPENIQKVVDFMNETGGSLQDYVKLNTDYSELNDTQLIKEYYETTKPHLDAEDIALLMEDFSYDEELDEPKDIRKAKIAFKEEAAKAKKHLESLKSQYYEEIKSGSRLNPDQQKAVEFFNRYKKENEEAQKVAESQKSIFNSKTNKLFSTNFKGFDFNVGDKKYRFNVNNIDEVRTTQSDINNFVKKFLNENNEMSDAAGYHRSLFTAMNADAVINHFYEQGKADAMKDSVQKAKNIDMDPRGTHENVKTSNGWTVRAVPGDSATSRLKIKSKR
jgi:hypothetical protein